jgi:hypothetical protein
MAKILCMHCLLSFKGEVGDVDELIADELG